MSFLVCFQGWSQTAWTWTPLADMPFETSNNAVTHGKMGGNNYIYSFGGIDTAKTSSGIHKRAFRYDVMNDLWDEIDTLPVTLPLIASSANTVKNKIYIIGGYHVYPNGSEVSSDEVIIYDPETNTYMPNGAPIPVAIDDQSQCVYKDSLIYVITGWSNTTNVPDVQIYDPANNNWISGTPLPNNNIYKVFGSSAQIIGDTIFYYGGASTAWNFPAQKILRKGIIDPQDPSQIVWSQEEDAPNSNYRSACVKHGNNVFWIGGSATSYNYNGIAYNGSGGVEPLTNIARYDSETRTWYEGSGTPYGVMDLRGNGEVSSTSWIICGGMESGQDVTNHTYLLEYDPVTGSIHEDKKPAYQLIDHQLYFEDAVDNVLLFSLDGKLVQQVKNEKINSKLRGVYILEFRIANELFRDKIYLR
ncbi:MAG: hypothetical protein WDZ35_01530 [Crocinitomicaceae bacterium]